MTLERLESAFATLVKWAHWFSAFILFPFMISVITIDVAGRFLFDSPLSWGTEGSGLIQILAIFLGAAIVEETNEHIQLDIFHSKFSLRGKALVGLLSSIVAGIWVYMLCSRSFTEIFVSYDMLESGMDVTIPFWPIRLVMTFAFLLLALKLIMCFFKNLQQLLRGGEHD